MFSSVEKPLQTLLITSTASEDGKSELIANLAVTFAQSGNKTILVDADLRKPQQHTLWNLPNQNGLSTMMLDDAQLANPPLVKIEAVDGLQVLPAGTPPPESGGLALSASG
ncbi:MAG UNVERIFIED_CONTAM: hypothetical protein LVT10_20160 [Anaerolineae bacterium]|jgi:non-specific protein-tyrosine kinase